MNQKLIIELAPAPGFPFRRYFAAEKFPFTIGRGFENDLILDDPHMAARQLRIEWTQETGWTIHNLDASPSNGKPVTSGDEIILGRTRLRLLTPNHPVAAPLPVSRPNETLSLFSKPLNALVYFFITVVAIASWSWLEIWSDNPGLTITIAVISVVLMILIWSALWALAGRVIRHRAELYSHIAVASTYVLASAVGYYIQSYVTFMANGGLVSTLTGYAINFTLIGALLFAALGLASDFSTKKRKVTAFLFAGGLVLGSFAVSTIEARSFHIDPDYPWTLEPYLASWAQADTPDEFIVKNAAVFDRKALKIKEKKKN